jgi:serine/threonine protein kinase
MVHGDLKPVSQLSNPSYAPYLSHIDINANKLALQANVLIDDWGHPRVCDFGLSRFIHSQESSGLTTTTAYTGTARYLAHELVESEESTLPSKESDVHALGCIGFEVSFILLLRDAIFTTVHSAPPYLLVTRQCWYHG